MNAREEDGSDSQRAHEENETQLDLEASAHLQLTDTWIGERKDRNITQHVRDGKPQQLPLQRAPKSNGGMMTAFKRHLQREEYETPDRSEEN